ncbi:hypothetical protein Tco_0997241 [Tanacetum coccineum]
MLLVGRWCGDGDGVVGGMIVVDRWRSGDVGDDLDTAIGGWKISPEMGAAPENNMERKGSRRTRWAGVKFSDSVNSYTLGRFREFKQKTQNLDMEIKQMKKLKASYGVTTPQELPRNHIKEEMSQHHWFRRNHFITFTPLSNCGQVEDMTRRLDMCGYVQIACSSSMGIDFEAVDVMMDVARGSRLGAWLRACCLFIIQSNAQGVSCTSSTLVLEFSFP